MVANIELIPRAPYDSRHYIPDQIAALNLYLRALNETKNGEKMASNTVEQFRREAKNYKDIQLGFLAVSPELGEVYFDGELIAREKIRKDEKLIATRKAIGDEEPIIIGEPAFLTLLHIIKNSPNPVPYEDLCTIGGRNIKGDTVNKHISKILKAFGTVHPRLRELIERGELTEMDKSKKTVKFDSTNPVLYAPLSELNEDYAPIYKQGGPTPWGNTF